MNTGTLSNEKNIRYEHQNNCNYIVVEADKEYNDYQFKMIKRNRPDHFLKFNNYSIDGKYGIFYDITFKQQLSKYYEYGKMNIEDVKTICMNISEMVRIADDYMLDFDHIKLQPQYIYMDVGTKKLNFLYHTDMDDISFSEGLKSLFEFILEHFDHNTDKESLVKLYEVYQRVLVGDYDPYNLNKMFGEVNNNKNKDIQIEEKTSEIIDTIVPETIAEDVELKNERIKYVIYGKLLAIGMIALGTIQIFAADYLPFAFSFNISLTLAVLGVVGLLLLEKIGEIKYFTEPVIATVNRDVAYKKTNKMSKKPTIEHNEEKVEREFLDNNAEIEDICTETMLLSDYASFERKRKLRLILQEENLIGEVEILKKNDNTLLKTIEIDKYPTVIGSLEKTSDIIIKAQVVSRMHCIISRDEIGDMEYYVEDSNATNGTFINGNRLTTHEKCKLSDGDILQIAALCFKVEIS